MKNKMNFRTNRIIQMICLGLFIISTPIIYAQKDTLHIKDIYSNTSNYLVLDKIINVDSTSKQELMNRFENWGGSNFRDYSNVRTSKTDDQITLLYINETSENNKMYVILKVEFKDNKAKISFSDDGNVGTNGSYVGGSYVSGTPSRLIHYTNFFEDGMIIYKKNAGSLNVKSARVKILLEYKDSINKTCNEIEKALKIKQTYTLKSDW